MQICPQCDDTPIEDLSCKLCGFQARCRDGVVYFHPEAMENFKDHSHDGLMAHVHPEKRHFWFRTRLQFLGQVFDQTIPKDYRFLEIGSGTGHVSEFLQAKGYDVSLGEIQPLGLNLAKDRGLTSLYQFDLYRPVFKNEFDAIGMFDVLEHLDAEKQALESLYQMLTARGRVVLTVPAHQWLWNKRDVIEKHKRRYELSELISLFEASGFKIVLAKHFFVSILPLLYLRALLTKNQAFDGTKAEMDEDFKIHPLVNFILFNITRLENWLLRPFNPKWGGSIVVVAEKN